MKALTGIILLATMGWLPIQASAVKPVADGPEGQRAFDDLAAVYAKGTSATFQPQSLKDSYGPTSSKTEILSQAADGSIYFTAKPDGDVVEELRNWAQAQPPRGFLATWWQTPTALLISYLVYRRWRYLQAHPRPPRRSIFSLRRAKP